MSKLGSIHTLALHSEQQGNKGLKFKLNNRNHRNSVFVYFNPLHPLAHPNPMHSDRRQRGEGQAAKQVANCFEKDFVIRIAMNIAMSITLPFRRLIAIRFTVTFKITRPFTRPITIKIPIKFLL